MPSADAATAPSDQPLALGAALAAITPQLSPIRETELAATSAAHRRILAAPLISPSHLPHSDLAAMDGYAVSRADLTSDRATGLRIVGIAAAGHPFAGSVARGEAVRILTGAPVPAGADCVVPQELCRVVGDTVATGFDGRGKSNCRLRGEDVTAGAEILPSGRRLRTQDLALAAVLGLSRLEVRRPLRVGLFSSGDELREPGEALDDVQIWDANRVLLPGLLAPLGCLVQDYGILRDEPLIVEGSLMRAARDCDLLITTGGMSVGSEDYIRSVIGRRGALEAWPVAIKPGKPVGFGDIDDCPILALPGNPVAAVIAFVAFGRPVVDALAGARKQALPTLKLPSGHTLTKAKGVRQFLLAEIAASGDGISTAVPLSRQSPAMLSPLTQTRGLLILGEDVEHVAAGEPVEFLAFDALMQ